MARGIRAVVLQMSAGAAALALTGSMACAAILGIDDIPPAGVFPIDSPESCEMLQQSSPAAIAQVCGAQCRDPKISCPDKVCDCFEGDGSPPGDGGFFPDVFAFDALDGPDSSGEDGPAETSSSSGGDGSSGDGESSDGSGFGEAQSGTDS